jgi:hypothetical protein
VDLAAPVGLRRATRKTGRLSAGFQFSGPLPIIVAQLPVRFGIVSLQLARLEPNPDERSEFEPKAGLRFRERSESEDLDGLAEPEST